MWSSTFLDKARHIPVLLALPHEKRFQVSGNDSIEWVLFRIAGPVDGGGGHAGIAECKPLRIPLHNGDSTLHHGLSEKSRLDRDNIIAFVSSLPTSVFRECRSTVL